MTEEEAAQEMVGNSLEKEIRSDASKERRLKRQQHRREVSLAKYLADKLDRWVLGRDEAGFMSTLAQEASELRKASFGPRLLRTIGWVYENASEQFFGALQGTLSFQQQVAQWRETSHA